MDFNELVQQAERNARRQERKVAEADREVKARQRQQMERMAYEKAREKMELKRRVAAIQQQQKAQPQQKSNKQQQKLPSNTPTDHRRGTQLRGEPPEPMDRGKRTNDTESASQKFVIPKKSIPLDEPSQATDKHSHSRPSNHQNSGNKRPRLAMPPTAQQDFKALMEQANQNDASAVEKLIQRVEAEPAPSAGDALRRKSAPFTAKKLTPADADVEVGVSAGRQLTHSAAARERAALTKQQQAALDKRKSLTSAGYRIPSSSEEQQQKVASSSTKVPIQQKTVAKIVERNPISNRAAQQSWQQPSDRTTSSKMHPKQNGAPIKDKKPTAQRNKVVATQQQPVVEQQQPQQLQQKRYLPGDIRYKGPAPDPLAAKRAAQAQVASSATGSVDKRKPTTTATSNSKPSVPLKKGYEKILPSLTPSSASNLTSTSRETTKSRSANELAKRNRMEADSLSELGRARARELELEAELRREREKVARMMAKAKEEAQQRSRKLQPQRAQQADSCNSLARIKREAQMRREMAMAQRRHRHHPSSSAHSRKYANYSDTDEEEEEEGAEDDDEYDSDLADFIDDSMVDDLQREDLEETLKIINPRYNKEKWMQRERMIDERRMDARFREVEAEEHRTSKLGLFEDVRELKRGSKAL